MGMVPGSRGNNELVPLWGHKAESCWDPRETVGAAQNVPLWGIRLLPSLFRAGPGWGANSWLPQTARVSTAWAWAQEATGACQGHVCRDFWGWPRWVLAMFEPLSQLVLGSRAGGCRCLAEGPHPQQQLHWVPILRCAGERELKSTFSKHNLPLAVFPNSSATGYSFVPLGLCAC